MPLTRPHLDPTPAYRRVARGGAAEACRRRGSGSSEIACSRLRLSGRRQLRWRRIVLRRVSGRHRYRSGDAVHAREAAWQNGSVHRASIGAELRLRGWNRAHRPSRRRCHAAARRRAHDGAHVGCPVSRLRRASADLARVDAEGLAPSFFPTVYRRRARRLLPELRDARFRPGAERSRSGHAAGDGAQPAGQGRFRRGHADQTRKAVLRDAVQLEGFSRCRPGQARRAGKDAQQGKSGWTGPDRFRSFSTPVPARCGRSRWRRRRGSRFTI